MKKFIFCFLMLWMFKDFVTLQNAVDFMNTLPQSAHAYVIALNSQRSGMFNGYYSVVYQQ